MKNTIARRFLTNTHGNLSILTAIVGTLLLTAVGASMDGQRLMRMKMQLQSITDAAALSAATPQNISDEARSDLALRTIESHAERRAELSLNDRNVQISDNGGTAKVQITADVPMLFGSFLGNGSRQVRASSVAQESVAGQFNAVSISVVLDLSASMQSRFDKGSRIAAVKAAVSDTFDMIEMRYGGEAAAQAQVSTGLYPFNWGKVDGELVALQPGTDTVVDALSFMALAEGSVPPSAMEAALADQITSGHGERYIVYLTDGSVDDEKGDQPGQLIAPSNTLTGAAANECTLAENNLRNTTEDVKNAHMEAESRFTNWGPSYRQNHLNKIATDPKYLMTTIDKFIEGHTSHGGNSGPKLRKVIALRKQNVIAEVEHLEACGLTQTTRLLDVCDAARNDGVSMIAINLAEEDQSANLITDYCALGHFDVEGATLPDGRTTPPPDPKAGGRTVNTDFEMKISIDGKSRSARVSELSQLREVLATMMPEPDGGQRSVRLTG